MAVALIIFFFAFYQLTSKIFSLSYKQKEVNRVLIDLQQATATAELKA